MRHEVIVGVERRRLWPDELKLSILSEIGVGGATVADVARRYDVSRQQVYQWRRQLRGKGLYPGPDSTVFLALDNADFEPEACEPAPLPDIEIALSNGRTLRCSAGMAEADVVRLIRVVETA